MRFTSGHKRRTPVCIISWHAYEVDDNNCNYNSIVAFCGKCQGKRQWRKKMKKIEKRCWQTCCIVVFYQSCPLRTAEARAWKKLTNFEKNKLTRWKACANIMTVPRLGRVPCKLNNERNEKHQTGAQKCATRSLREVPGLVNYREKRKDKKF